MIKDKAIIKEILDFRTSKTDMIGIENKMYNEFLVSKNLLYKKIIHGRNAKAIISGFKIIRAPIIGTNVETIKKILIICTNLKSRFCKSLYSPDIPII
tara:strand:+ start:211 stop:504 length:294 start_codon:yes stop_codon:yes gene_type:complete